MSFAKNKITKLMSRIVAFGLLLTFVCNAGSIPETEVTIVGGGIAGALHAYHAHREALKSGTKVCVTICEKNSSYAGTTAANIAPSLTPDEILSVVPRGKALVEKLQIPFNQPGGIRVNDVAGVNSSKAAHHFIEQAEIYSHDVVGYQERTKTLLSLGKMSMDLWQTMYDEADPELKAILVASNFNPCREVTKKDTKVLHDGYRIDLIYNIPNAADRAQGMKADYEGLGYQNCTTLSPSEVMTIDPFLSDFCKNHATSDATGTLQWHNDSIALWRPGGCLDAKVFLPKFYEYLKKAMGTYKDQSGNVQDCFQILYGKEVQKVELKQVEGKTVITSLTFGDGAQKHNDDTCKDCSYVFCPGEAVGTLNKLGFKEPAYARFAGASLLLSIPVPADKVEEYSAFNHCMEVHQEGVVLAWQARFVDGKIFIGVAGTKAFYGDQNPTKDQAFAKDRNLLQLNMVNDVLPEFISLALGRNTKSQKLDQADIDSLEQKGIAKRWAGTRAVVFDGFPSLGTAYKADGTEIDNALVTTHLGSGGVSFGPAAVAVSCSAQNNILTRKPLVDNVLGFAKSNRVAVKST